VSRRALARERAAAFVAARGDALARARAEALLGRAPRERALSALEARDARAAPDRIRHLVGVCADLRALDAPLVELACGHLARTQSSDGGWGDAARDTDEERIRLTGLLAGQLAKTRFARPETLDAAGAFLSERWGPDRVQGSRWQGIAAFACYFANAPHEQGDAVLQWCGRELERGFRTRAFDAVSTARVLLHCDASGLPGGRFEPGELVVALLTEQQEDGSWPVASHAGAGDPVERTLDALLALLRLAR
jgi:hypothetical protein